jgi:hypothetical protein
MTTLVVTAVAAERDAAVGRLGEGAAGLLGATVLNLLGLLVEEQISLPSSQRARLVALVDEHGDDHAATALALDAWCEAAIRPWFADHVATDAAQSERWAGRDVDPTRPPTSDLVVSATAADPSLMAVVAPYLVMAALPDTLAAVHPRVQEIYASGWRPPPAEGPTRDELADVVASASPDAATALA